jgi:hypothetical protein
MPRVEVRAAQKTCFVPFTLALPSTQPIKDNMPDHTSPDSLAPARRDFSTRRTFAIISHPDAGKTTLTERLLFAAGAVHLAGSVRARGERRRTRSDWMEIERQRGISISSSVMTFESRSQARS